MSIKIGKYEIPHPIIQGGMGVGISWDRLAGTVSALGGLGTISSVGTGYYQNCRFAKHLKEGRPLGAMSTFSREALFEIFRNARKICGNAPLACNILHVITDYKRVVKDAIDAGANIIVTGAGLPTDLAKLVEGHDDVAIVPIVSSGKALKVIARFWQRAGRLPDAVIVEGPLSGGHQGVPKEELENPAHSLEAILQDVVEERNKWGDMPVIAAGGIWTHEDAQRMMALGADAVQLGTRFALTHESDAAPGFKEVLLAAEKEDVEIIKSPVGYPARAVNTALIQGLEPRPIDCKSNCVVPCNHGEGASKVGYCISDSLGDSSQGKKETGLFFCGANVWRAKELLSVRQVMEEILGEPLPAKA